MKIYIVLIAFLSYSTFSVASYNVPNWPEMMRQKDREQEKEYSLERKKRQDQNTTTILNILNKRHPENLGSNPTAAEDIARLIEINFAKSDAELKTIIYDYLQKMLTVEKKNE